MRNRRSDITQGWGVLQSLISPSKGNEKKEVITTRFIRFWSPIQVPILQNRAQIETQIETNKRNLVQNAIAWISFNRTSDSNKIEVIVLDDQKSRD